METQNLEPTLEMFAQVVCVDANNILEAYDTKEQFIDAITGKKPCDLYTPEELAALIWDQIVEQFSIGHSLGQKGCEHCKKSRYHYNQFFETYDIHVKNKEFSDLRPQNTADIV